MSNSLLGVGVHPVVEALHAVDEALSGTADAALWALPDDELEALVDRCEQLAARQAELALRLVAEADGRDLGRRLGASSTAAWLRGRFRIRPADARARVELANRLAATTEAPVDYAANVAGPASGREMPATAAALAAGEISEQHALVIAKAIGRLPDRLTPDAAAEAERQLTGWARQLDPAQLATLAHRLIDALIPDTLADDEDDAARRRELRLSEHTGRLSGRLDPEAMTMVRAMLDPLAAPQTGEDAAKDTRSPATRMADALIEVARRVLNHTDWLPTRHGTRPHLNLITQLDHDGHSPTGDSRDSDRHPDGYGPGDVHPDGAGHTYADSDAHPGRDAATRRPRFGPGEPTWGQPLSTATVARIACDARITWIITNPAGVPLNVGREHRTITPGQWTALLVRDGRCTFPGCTRTADWCEAHHIRWWRYGGPTDLDNLCLLCAHHHRAVHHGGWDIQLGSDRHPEFIPPPWIDPTQTPRRNNQPRHYRNKSP